MESRPCRNISIKKLPQITVANPMGGFASFGIIEEFALAA
jgi:hypothetical protein